MSKVSVETANTVEDLLEVLGDDALAIIKVALLAQEKTRVYHKTAYLKRQERNRRIEAELERRGIIVE